MKLHEYVHNKQLNQWIHNEPDFRIRCQFFIWLQIWILSSSIRRWIFLRLWILKSLWTLFALIFLFYLSGATISNQNFRIKISFVLNFQYYFTSISETVKLFHAFNIHTSFSESKISIINVTPPPSFKSKIN